MLTGLILCLSHSGTHSYCEFMNLVVLLGSDDTLLLQSPVHGLASYNLSTRSFRRFLSPGEESDTDVSSVAELSADTLRSLFLYSCNTITEATRRKKDLFWAYGIRGIRVHHHHGRQGSVSAGAVAESRGLTFSTAKREQREGVGYGRILFSKAATVLLPTRPQLLTPQSSTTWRLNLQSPGLQGSLTQLITCSGPARGPV